MPANSTDIAPPDIPAGFVVVFNSDEASWHLVEDHRGKTVYDVASGDALFISELGPLPENVTGIPGRVSEVERHIMDKGYGGRNLVAGSTEDVSGVAEPS